MSGIATDSVVSSSARQAAIDVVRIAGCAFSVRVSSSAGPLNMISLSSRPNTSSTSSKTSRAELEFRYRSLPIPTACEPCPGKTNAVDLDSVSPVVRCRVISLSKMVFSDSQSVGWRRNWSPVAPMVSTFSGFDVESIRLRPVALHGSPFVVPAFRAYPMRWNPNVATGATYQRR